MKDKLYTLEEILNLLKEAWKGGEKFIATEGKIYKQSINFEQWLIEKKLL